MGEADLSGESVPREPPAEEPDPAAVEAFRAQAWAMAAWHRDQGDSFEGKAGSALGFSGVILTLLTLAAAPIAEVRSDTWRTALVGLMIAAAGAFLFAAVGSIMVLRPRKYRFSSTSQLRTEWEKFYEGKPMSHADALMLFTDQLICGSQGETGPIASLAADTETRGHWVARSICSMLVGFALLVAVAAIVLIEVGAP